jgi:hypothetical protein
MKFYLFAFYLLPALIFAVPVLARADSPNDKTTLQRIIELTSDQDQNINYLSVMEDPSGDAEGIESDPDSKNTSTDNISTSVSLAQIESDAGAVLLVRDGKNALILKGSLNSKTDVGQFTLSYLSNGLLMTYDSCDFLLKRDSGGWYVQNSSTGLKVTSVKVETWSLGITTISGICSGS